jgi:Spy/CpxP family protein refolding chaperone
MKKFLPALSVGLILGTALGALGQWAVWRHWKKQGQDPAGIVEKLSRKLSLSEAQKAALKTILEAKSVKMKALYEQAEAIHSSSRGEIRRILAPEQAEKFDAMVARRQARRKQRPFGLP